MGRAYFYMEDYDNSITWLEKSVQVRDNVWYSRVHLISAYALKERPELKAALSEYREKFKNWPLEKVQDWYTNEIQNPPSDFKGLTQKLFKGLQKAGL